MSKNQRYRSRLARLLNHVANLPPVAWGLRWTGRTVTRRMRQNARKRLRDTRETRPAVKIGGGSLEDILKDIVYDVVATLGYVGAMVATLEAGDELPVRAFYIDPDIAHQEQIRAWERKISAIAGKPISLKNPDAARVKLHDTSYAKNLSVKAAIAQRPIPSGELYSLFTPIAPAAAKPFVEGIQTELGIAQVIAVPFFLEVEYDDKRHKELVGNLFVASATPFTEADILLLVAFARQASAAIESERRRQQLQVVERLVSVMHTHIEDEAVILQEIVEGVVRELDFVGAIVATYEEEENRSLPVRAFHIHPSYASMEQINEWEKKLTLLSDADHPLSLSNPETARVELGKRYHHQNLSVKAVNAEKPVTSNRLYDLFTPFVPAFAQPVVEGIQNELNIQQVIAVPFYLPTKDGKKLLGNLFGATRSNAFSAREIEMLRAFGQQAAIGIRNARLYQKAEQRRRVAQDLGMEAFTSSAYVHEMGNLLTPVKGHIDLLNRMQPQTAQDYEQFFNRYHTTVAPQLTNVNEMAKIIQHLRHPWQHTSRKDAYFHDCLALAIDKGVQRVKKRQPNPYKIHIDVNDADVVDDLPPIKTSPDMLKQALVTILQNSTEAIIANGGKGIIDIHATCEGNDIKVLVRDDGIGIKHPYLRHVFDMQFTLKNGTHRGFGLYWTKEYIEGLGGTIQMISLYKEGTIVQLKIPVNRDRQEEREAENEQARESHRYRG